MTPQEYQQQQAALQLEAQRESDRLRRELDTATRRRTIFMWLGIAMVPVAIGGVIYFTKRKKSGMSGLRRRRR